MQSFLVLSGLPLLGGLIRTAAALLSLGISSLHLKQEQLLDTGPADNLNPLMSVSSP